MRIPEEMLLIELILHNYGFITETNEYKALLIKTRSLVPGVTKNVKTWQFLNDYVETLANEMIDSGYEVDFGTAIDYENGLDELKEMLQNEEIQEAKRD